MHIRLSTTVRRSRAARRIATAAAAAIAATAVAAPSATASFNLAKFQQSLTGQLANVTGYGYAVALDGSLLTSGGGGTGRIASDSIDGAVKMTGSSKMEIWSATKTYTATMALKLLEAHLGASLDGPITPWLPDGWKVGTGFDSKGVTFRQLLDHTSGLGQVGQNLTAFEKDMDLWNTRWFGVQYAVGRGTKPGSAYNYTNMNYALLRVLNAELVRELEPGKWPTQDETNTGKINLALINRDLLKPAGVPAAGCSEPGFLKSVLHYNADAPDSGGALVELTGSGEQACAGHRGLHLSAIDMVRFMTHLRHGSIVSPGVRKLMDAGRLGWNPNSNVTYPGVYWHGGDGFVGSGREGHTCQMAFPNSVEATLIINSSRKGVGTTQCGALVEAWQAATT